MIAMGVWREMSVSAKIPHTYFNSSLSEGQIL
jgi:hypothetical protein